MARVDEQPIETLTPIGGTRIVYTNLVRYDTTHSMAHPEAVSQMLSDIGRRAAEAQETSLRTAMLTLRRRDRPRSFWILYPAIDFGIDRSTEDLRANRVTVFAQREGSLVVDRSIRLWHRLYWSQARALHRQRALLIKDKPFGI